MFDSPAPDESNSRKDTISHFILSLAVAWPVLWFWSSQLGEHDWNAATLLMLPLILVAGVVLVWLIFTFAVWKDSDTRAYDAEAKITIVVIGTTGVAAWFVLALAALFLVPWVGAGEVGIGVPNPLGFLGAGIGGLAASWFAAIGV